MKQENDSSAEGIRRSAERMQRARDERGFSPLRGIGVFGMIGWSIAVPTVVGAFLGVWLDRLVPQSFSWPIALILAGIVIGIMVAASWVSKEVGNGGDSRVEGSERKNGDIKSGGDDK